MDPLFRWVFAGLTLMGSPFAAIGVYEVIQASQDLGHSARARGTVSANRLLVDRRDGNEEHSYQPVIEFRDSAGLSRRFTDPVGSLPPDYAVGDTVELAYEPKDPGHARIVSWKRVWLVPSLLIGVGLLPGLVFLIFWWRLVGGSPHVKSQP
jgi:hypothetical protein